MSAGIQYPDTLIERLHTIWGDGFLSPGGPEEVAEIVTCLDLDDKTIFDIGFGTGGPIIALAQKNDVARIVGIDVELPMRDRAAKNIERAGHARAKAVHGGGLRPSPSSGIQADALALFWSDSNSDFIDVGEI